MYAQCTFMNFRVCATYKRSVKSIHTMMPSDSSYLPWHFIFEFFYNEPLFHNEATVLKKKGICQVTGGDAEGSVA